MNSVNITQFIIEYLSLCNKLGYYIEGDHAVEFNPTSSLLMYYENSKFKLIERMK